MKPDWESGLRGRIYAFGRRVVPLAWRRALRRRGAARAAPRPAQAAPSCPGSPLTRSAPPGRAARRPRPSGHRLELPAAAAAAARRGPRPRGARASSTGRCAGRDEPEEPAGVAPGVTLLPIAGVRREDPADRRLADPALGRRSRASTPRASALRNHRRRRAGRVAVLGAAGRGAARAVRLADRLRLPRRARGVRNNRPGVLDEAERRSPAPRTSSWRPPSRSGGGSRNAEPAGAPAAERLRLRALRRRSTAGAARRRPDRRLRRRGGRVVRHAAPRRAGRPAAGVALRDRRRHRGRRARGPSGAGTSSSAASGPTARCRTGTPASTSRSFRSASRR